MELVLIWAAIGAGVCWYVAGQKGRNQVAWAIGGALFGVFAIIAVFIVSDLSKQQPLAAALAPASAGLAAPEPALAAGPPVTSAPPVNDEHMPCPNCGESIPRAAKVCRFCNHDLSATGSA